MNRRQTQLRPSQGGAMRGPVPPAGFRTIEDWSESKASTDVLVSDTMTMLGADYGRYLATREDCGGPVAPNTGADLGWASNASGAPTFIGMPVVADPSVPDGHVVMRGRYQPKLPSRKLDDGENMYGIPEEWWPPPATSPRRWFDEFETTDALDALARQSDAKRPRCVVEASLSTWRLNVGGAGKP